MSDVLLDISTEYARLRSKAKAELATAQAELSVCRHLLRSVPPGDGDWYVAICDYLETTPPEAKE